MSTNALIWFILTSLNLICLHSGSLSFLFSCIQIYAHSWKFMPSVGSAHLFVYNSLLLNSWTRKATRCQHSFHDVEPSRCCLNARERLWLLRRVGQLLKNFKKTCKDMCMSQRSWALVILGRPVEESGSIWPTPLISQERLWILRAHWVPCMFFKKRLRDSALAFTRGWTRGWVLESH